MHQHVIYMADKEYYCSLLDPQLKNFYVEHSN